MREYILTDRERQIIEGYLNGVPLNGFRVLKHISKRALPRLEEDLALIKQFLEKA